MKKFAALLVAGSTIALATPAMAQSADENFVGPRVEALVGYDIVQAGSSVDDDGADNNDQSMDGVNYGIGLGYDFNIGGAVVGLEGEWTDSTAKTEFDDGDFEGFGFGRVDAGRDLYLGARVGTPIAPDVLLYAKGGYTNAKLNVLASDGTTELKQDFDLDGWRAGAGVEYAMNPNTFLKLEYRYSNYQKGEVDFDGDLPDSDRFDVDLDRHQVMAGVGMRF
ncbi:Outer membrane protein-like [Altererythrobacter epoxidivorans]|uniref:Outer membrane protein-like n=1 Tax=Altererythrobacter epoxidivorans TaxID=361183 RepID=A0A0M4LUU1_9SPHN|nr:outer membrane beta-barrel protein [Altererythrobacter epoxidivorans]ALE16767.1 Outer membrane protein-like [Altererythrobacter epoxidivorans]